MKASAIVQPMTLEEIQQLRRLARHPQLRGKAVEVVEMIRANRDQVQQFVDDQRTRLFDAETALAAANKCLHEAEHILSELEA